MVVASRYAKSLLDLANEKAQTETVYADMLQLKSICAESKDFKVFLNSPVISSEKKIETIKALFNGKLSALTVNFLETTVAKRRESYVPQIVTSFIEQYKINKNILSAIVTTANGLDAATKQQVLDLVKTQLKTEVELVEKTNADLIGGFVLTIGDKQIDKSVARQLSNLKKQLTTN